MEKFKKIIYKLLGMVYIPEYIRKRNFRLVLHISDTPSSFYYNLKRIIKKINPEYIIHTGDLVDNIKLEFVHYSILSYSRNLKILIDMLEKSKAKQIYISLGNHDNKEEVEKLCRRINIIDICDDIQIENLNLRISHFPGEILKNPNEYNLFGHNTELETNLEKNKKYLNGIEHINLINLNNGEVVKLEYPFGLNEERFRKGKMGL